MSIFSNHFPLGLGTSRFPIAGPDDAKGIEQSIALVYQALERRDYICRRWLQLFRWYGSFRIKRGIPADGSAIFRDGKSDVWA